MLTPFYNTTPVVKSIFSPLRMQRNYQALLVGMVGLSAVRKDIGMTVSDVARAFQVSRQAVYKSITRIFNVESKARGLPDVPVHCVLVTKKDVDKAILSLALDGHSSIEGIQRVLTRIYGKDVSPSIGYISELLNKAGAFAAQITQSIPLHNIHQGANDEIFDGSDNPVFTGVDADSTYVYLMQAMDDRKGETWQLVMETLKDSGLDLEVAISDAGRGLLSGVKAAFPNTNVQIDVFHALKDIGGAVCRFQKHILGEVSACYDLEKAVDRAKRPWSERIRTKKKRLDECQAKMPVMVEDHDLVECLYDWIHELLSFSGYPLKDVMELMDWLTTEMETAARRHKWAYELRTEICRFKARLPALLLFLGRLFERFQRAARELGLPVEAFKLLYRRWSVAKESVAYAELTRQALAVIGSERFEAARKVHDRIVMGTKRASSLVENVNSRLRAYMNIKKCVSDSFYSLVQLHLNTKKYRRSRVKSRQGRSPVEIMTGESWPELIDLLEERVFWSSWNRRKAA